MVTTISASQEAYLRQLEIRLEYLKKESLLAGIFSSLRAGMGVNAIGLDLYNPQAHDIRRVNWMRSEWDGDWYVNLYEPELSAVAVGVFGLSPSEYFGTAQATKFDILCGVAVAFSQFFSWQGNSFGWIEAGEGSPAVQLPQGDSLVSYRLFHELSQTRTPDGKHVMLRDGLLEIPARYHKAEFAVIADDFQSNDWEVSLRQVTTDKATVCIQPLDPWELELPDLGEINLVDPVSGEQKTLILSGRRGRRIREEYADRAKTRQDKISNSIQAAHADHLVLRTDEDWISKLIGHFRQRRYQPWR